MRPWQIIPVMAAVLAGPAATAPRDPDAVPVIKRPQPATAAMKATALKTLDGVPPNLGMFMAGVSRVSVSKPANEKAWLTFLAPDGVFPRQGLAFLTDPEGMIRLDFKYAPGKIHLVDCEIENGSKLVGIKIDTVQQQVAVASGHLIVAVPAKAAGAAKRSVNITSLGNQLVLRQCEISQQR